MFPLNYLTVDKTVIISAAYKDRAVCLSQCQCSCFYNVCIMLTDKSVHGLCTIKTHQILEGKGKKIMINVSDKNTVHLKT